MTPLFITTPLHLIILKVWEIKGCETYSHVKSLREVDSLEMYSAAADKW